MCVCVEAYVGENEDNDETELETGASHCNVVIEFTTFEQFSQISHFFSWVFKLFC